MRRPTLLAIALAFAGIAPLHAQQPPVAASVVSSSAGKASAVNVVELAATVVGIDKATRTVTLRGPQGRTLDVVCGDEVRNFDQIRVGDQVGVRYQESLSLELKKASGQAAGAAGGAVAARAAPGSRPAGIVGREIQVLADVVAVDQAKSTVSLKGPRGNVVDLKVQNPDHFKVVKVGDQVEAVYTEAIAVAVTPAPKSAVPAKK
jgi:hypothetical protein